MEMLFSSFTNLFTLLLAVIVVAVAVGAAVDGAAAAAATFCSQKHDNWVNMLRDY